MRDPLLDWREGGCVARKGDELLPIGEVRGEPVECSALMAGGWSSFLTVENRIRGLRLVLLMRDER